MLYFKRFAGRGQNCYIKSYGKSNIKSLIKLQSISFILHMEPIVLVSAC